MEDVFDLPVNFNGTALQLPARLKQTGYTHQFEVEINELMIVFEPDEEGSYRAIITPQQNEGGLDVALLAAVAKAIEEIVR